MPHKDPQANREYQQRWRDANRGKIRTQQRTRGALHRDAENERLRQYKLAHPERRLTAQRRYKLKQYGLTLDEYDQLVASQEGRCAVCSHKPRSNLHVDHDHKTGKVRGLLCGNCNRALGILKEDPKRITALAEYAALHDKGGDARNDHQL